MGSDTVGEGRAVRTAVAILGLAVTLGLGACSGSDAGVDAARTAAGGSPRAVTIAYADALLHGGPSDYRRYLTPSCRRTHRWDVRALQDGMRRRLGRPLDQVHVVGAVVVDREPHVVRMAPRYDLPVAKTGNDNALTLTQDHGRWAIADCATLPIGGSSAPSLPATGR